MVFLRVMKCIVCGCLTKKVVTMWVAMEIVSRATTIKKIFKIPTHTSALGEEKRSVFGLTDFLKDKEEDKEEGRFD